MDGAALSSLLWITGRCRLSYIFVIVSYSAYLRFFPLAQEKRCKISDPPAGVDAHVQASDEPAAVVTLAPLRPAHHCSTDGHALDAARVSAPLWQILLAMLYATTRKQRVRLPVCWGSH